MARTDRAGISRVLDRVRRVALEIDARTSIVPLPARPAQPDEVEQRMALYDTLITDAPLKQATRKLFKDGHYSDAVGKACTVLSTTVKKKSGISDRDGVSLMNHAFGEQAPLLAITSRKSDVEKDEHNGYRSIFAGAMLGIRNPRHHAADVSDEPDVALEMLVLVNHLLRVAGHATRKRKPKAPASPAAKGVRSSR